jgi:hypothetical protein
MSLKNNKGGSKMTNEEFNKVGKKLEKYRKLLNL